MFKGHPKGLLVAFFANMGERFGFYTMMAILVFFLQARYNLATDEAGNIYSWFYFMIYALALLGGIIADKTQNYKGIIMIGIITMLAGYVLMALPNFGLTVTLIGLFTISFGNGLFKGNLQALVGQMYDDPKYKHLRDSAFSVFYMGINIGAFFAPSAANGIRNWFLKTHGYVYDADLPGLCNSYISGKLPENEINTLQELANKVTATTVTDIAAFANDYINVFSTGYNYAFGIAAFAMIISFIIYAIFKKHLPDRKSLAHANSEVTKMPWSEEKPRVIALIMVFFVVIFFWMSFHQNGLTLSYFARDYTTKSVSAFTNIFFNLWACLSFIAAIAGIVFLVRKSSTSMWRAIGAGLLLVGGGLTFYFYQSFGESNPIEPEIFQQFNPIFIVFLTPVVIWLFSFLQKKGIEPSTPKKIGIGMILAALGFVVMLAGSYHLASPLELNGVPATNRVSPYWLIDTYLVLTIAELFLSPMGISFVSKVAPPRLQGLMQGGWLGATAIGNKLLFVGSFMWVRIELWQLWLIFVVCCLISASVIFTILKRLERVTGSH